MKRKIICILIGVVFLIVLLTACTVKKQEEGKKEEVKKEEVKEMDINEDNGTLATKEYLIDLFLITEEDLDGIPVDEILYYFKITVKNLNEIKEDMKENASIITNLKLLQKSMEEEKQIEKEYGTIDFTYILGAKEQEGEFPNIDSIHYLVDSYNIGEGGYSCVIDFEKNKVYYEPNTASAYRDIRYAEKVIDLTPELKEEIIKEIEDAKLEEWDYEYDGYRGKGGEECFWKFGVEFNDGTIVSNRGLYGNSPKEYITLRDELYEKLNEY
ncbi:hypothetical protein [Anaerosporobacter sp.]